MKSGLLARVAAYKPLHFIALGALLFLLYAPQPRTEAIPREPLQLDQQQLDALRGNWIAAIGRAPSDLEMQGLIRREIDDEILFREAVERSVHLYDPVIRQRLVLNMRFLGAPEQRSDDELFDEALQLGMHRNDIVVRRRLVQIMEMSIQDAADREPVSEAELQAMYELRREELTVPARWRISHVYFSVDRRGERGLDDARAALQRLRSGDVTVQDAPGLGDPFLGGHALPLFSESQLAGQFGTDFAASVAGCPLQQWCEPLGSSFGVHLVWVEEYVPARVPDIGEPEVRRRLVADVVRERGKKLLSEALSRLREHYGVTS